MKKLALILSLLTVAISLSFANNLENTTLDTLGVDEVQISVEKNVQSLDVVFHQAQADIQITVLEAEEGIVYSNFSKNANHNEHIDFNNLPSGSYTLLVEYKNRVVKSQEFIVE